MRSSMSRTAAATFLYLYRILYGDQVSLALMCRYIFLSTTLFFTLMGHWMLRSIRDPVTVKLVGGGSLLPQVRGLSFLLMIPLILLYNYLLSRYYTLSDKRHRVFYLLASVFGAIQIIFAVWLKASGVLEADATLGGTSILTQHNAIEFFRVCLLYFTMDAFGPLLLCIFWSFANSHFTYSQAIACYGIILSVGEVGSWMGPACVNMLLPSMSLETLYALSALCFWAAPACFYLYLGTLPTTFATSHDLYEANQDRDQGLNVGNEHAQNSLMRTSHKTCCCCSGSCFAIVADPYTWGLFLLECLNAAVWSMMGFSMKVVLEATMIHKFPCEEGMVCYSPIQGKLGVSEDARDSFLRYMTRFAYAADQGALLLGLFGTSFVLRQAGLQRSLVILPLLCVLSAFIMFVIGNPPLSLVSAVMVLVRVFGHAVFVPCREILYMPTHSTIRYHLRPWFTIVSVRLSAAIVAVLTSDGSTTTEDSSWSPSTALALTALLIALALLLLAVWMGRKCIQRLRLGQDATAETGEGIALTMAGPREHEDEDITTS